MRNEPRSHETDWDVIVLGAGMSGLAAGRALAQAGLRVLLLEAKDRVGGRIHTVRTGAGIIELGAEFVHGRPPELLKLIEEAGLELYERTGDFLQAGEDGPEAEADSREDILEGLRGYQGPDKSFLAYADQLDLQAAGRADIIGYVEGFNAADAREASIVALGRQQIAEDAIEGDRVWRLRDGYDLLPQFLAERFQAAGGTLLLQTRAEHVTWEPGSVRIQAASHEFHGRRAIITLPLGVLQAGLLRFTPDPGPILNIINNLRMGPVCRFTLTFSRRVWPETMSFLIGRQALPNVWWTAHPAKSLTVTGWVGGPRSAELLGRTPDELQQLGCTALAESLNLDIAEILNACTGIFTHTWQADPDTLGAYSWIAAGSADQPAKMTEPVAQTLFFAGEHTDTTGHWGTVHAALGTGLRAARQVLENGLGPDL